MVNLTEVIHNIYYCSKSPHDKVLISIPEIGEYEIKKVYQENRNTDWRSYETIVVLEAEK